MRPPRLILLLAGLQLLLASMLGIVMMTFFGFIGAVLMPPVLLWKAVLAYLIFRRRPKAYLRTLITNVAELIVAVLGVVIGIFFLSAIATGALANPAGANTFLGNLLLILSVALAALTAASLYLVTRPTIRDDLLAGDDD